MTGLLPRTGKNRKGDGNRRISPALMRLTAAVLILALLGGCVQWLEPILPGLFSPPPTSTPEAPITLTPEAEASVTPEPQPTFSGAVTLTLWLPPQFDPAADTPAAQLLQQRLDAFMEENPGVLIHVRIKAPSGPGGLLESLTAAAAAAPAALPSVIALNRGDLEAAALKGLIYPLEGVSEEIESVDWYPYARQLSRVQDIPFALPIAGDALMLFYRPASVGGSPPQTWQEVLAFGNPLLFAGDDPQALLTLTLYRSLGGLVQDLQGRPALQADLLQQVFELYQEGARRGTFPQSVTQYQSGGQVWQAYLEGQADWAVTFASFYLSELPADTTPMLLPSLGGDDFTQAIGWGLAIADPDPQRRQMAVELAEYLNAADFLAEWAVAAGYLPVHPTSLSAWQPVTLQNTLSRVVLSAQIRPSNEILASLGPVLRESGLAVLRNQSSPAQAAQSAVEKLLTP
ncbi:ABC-type sugar transport system, periplasmic component [Bellilinea caldifistulae]|uniref:Extracellular solute-binding protein n=1 Tax=Bellilinea caldifistulae TaxID=360411 RepID=A0A0P6XTA2_9CHLR|nr:extracellular solute-binding protein [Bellilinea caldifistulae]KPL76344.1 hypothetical protein AC812_06685 [Bellilinea caldifistulae]GAP12027.1 ABC-type sugar transport system, periplasmic component [Bellilinea caldifistulae]